MEGGNIEMANNIPEVILWMPAYCIRKRYDIIQIRLP